MVWNKKICKSYICKLYIRICKELLQLNNKVLIIKGEKVWIGIYSNKIYQWPTNGQEACEKLLNTLSHWGNSSLNLSEVLLYTYWRG